ncbi:MAG: DUF1512 domain-containing protein [Hyperthermus sp.]|nr:MAG: DUF1512 domain-containing protein [Hyperthermus sp.]
MTIHNNIYNVLLIHGFFPFSSNTSTTETGSSLATWIIALSILASTIMSMLAFLGISQGMQLRIWKNQVESKLRIIEGYVREAESSALELLKSSGARNPQDVVARVKDFFMIGPVTIEPIDIIRRLESIIRTGEVHIERIVKDSLPSSISEHILKNTVTLLSLLNALNTIYKYLRHLLLLGVKSKNAMLVAQVWMMMPLYLRIAKAYREAVNAVSKGIPIGDSAGPLAAYKIAMESKPLSKMKEIVKDTVYGEYNYEDRRLIVVKAKGPGSTVGRPGEAVEKLLEDTTIASSLAAIITIDAALKFEGEETGTIAEGIGVAMGDPGPEKIRIERLASKLRVPLYAIVVKMSMEEAINAITQNIVEGVTKAVEKAKRIIKESTRPGDTIILVGVGNSIGVGQA